MLIRICGLGFSQQRLHIIKKCNEIPAVSIRLSSKIFSDPAVALFSRKIHGTVSNRQSSSAPSTAAKIVYKVL